MPDSEFRLLADYAPVMVWRTNASKHFDWFNKPWLDFTGRTMQQELGFGWMESVHPEDCDRCRHSFATAFDGREPFSMEYRLRRSDGVWRWVLDKGQAYFRDGAFAGYFGSCLDVTEHRDSERRLREALEEREVLLREVHHRVKNNLQSLLALVRLTRRDADPGTRETLDRLSQRLAAMALVQRELHGADSLTRLSARPFIETIITELGDPQTIRTVDIDAAEQPVSSGAAAYLGLAVAEAVALFLRHECHSIDVVALALSHGWSLRLTGACPGLTGTPSGFEIRLIQHYARGAGARSTMVLEGQSLSVDLTFGLDPPTPTPN